MEEVSWHIQNNFKSKRFVENHSNANLPNFGRLTHFTYNFPFKSDTRVGLYNAGYDSLYSSIAFILN